MPIIEPADLQLPLSQGDVLKDVRLFVTKDTWEDSGGDFHKTPHKLCLVISRPCVVGHKPYAVVAAIEKMGDNVPRDVETFEDIRSFLTDLRDGPESPDVFYLGQVRCRATRAGLARAWTPCTRSRFPKMQLPSAGSWNRNGSENSPLTSPAIFIPASFAPLQRWALTTTAGCPRTISAGSSLGDGKRYMTPGQHWNRRKLPS
jgi:hypothetical protein